MAKIVVDSKDVNFPVYMSRSTEVAYASECHQTVDKFGDDWVRTDIMNILAELGYREEFPCAKKKSSS